MLLVQATPQARPLQPGDYAQRFQQGNYSFFSSDLVKTIVTEPVSHWEIGETSLGGRWTNRDDGRATREWFQMKLRHPLSAFTHSESALSTGPTSRRIQNSDKEEELAPEWKSP